MRTHTCYLPARTFPSHLFSSSSLFYFLEFSLLFIRYSLAWATICVLLFGIVVCYR
ncbi:unnamed protein product [Hymenolepis diminuta]|uniref:Uncharacterized protein n=1 Tax=Hymenolepis diminuta TaxID=6216 RepID=A0A564YV54_HYMDI|nr:unnamed protein product [Hymenolepis diminuta]